MKKSLLTLSVSLLVIMAIVFTGCVKDDPPAPPVAGIPMGDTTVTIAGALGLTSGGENGSYSIDDQTVDVYGWVTMDERSGNLYKEIYLQDSTGAIDVRLTEGGGFVEGDYVRIHLTKGTIISYYNYMPQLQNVQNDSNVVIIANGENISPKVLSIEEAKSGDYTAKLVKFTGVQFADGELGKTYADAVGLSTENRSLVDTLGNSILVRTSGYSSFANKLLPEGNGSVIAILGRFGSDYQLYIRSVAEVKLDNPRVGGGGGGGDDPVPAVDEVDEEFNSAENYTDISIQGWRNYIVSGDRKWQGKEFNEDKYAQASGYNSGLDAMETWLITPPVKNESGDKILNFKSSIAYWTHGSEVPFRVMASTEYDGTNFATATWTELNPALPTATSSNYTWVDSDDVSLADYTGEVAIAFVYNGSNTLTTSWCVDNITINTTGGGGGGGGDDPIPPVDSVNEQFDGAVNYTDTDIEGWKNMNIIGDRKWQGKVFNEDKYVQSSGYNSGLDAMEVWLVTPPVKNQSGDKTLSFSSCIAFWEHGTDLPYQIMASTDYDGTNLETANWVAITTATLPTSSTANYAWIDSGAISLADFSGDVAIAFVYSGSDTQSTSWCVDSVVVE